ncbi:hypothetical protein CCR96_02905 [Halochromatium roseum]|nr:hypothetical protein [Halochromatium roseum]
MELWQDDRTTVEQLAHLVQADPALCGRLLKLANSASLGSRPVSSINAAIIKVGLKTVGELAVAFSLIDKGHSNHCEAFDYLEFWSHSLLMGLLCRALGRRTKVAPPEDLFSCALMSRIGLLAFATIYPSEYSELLKAHPANLAAAEFERFGFDHNELSAEMLSDFGVPNVLAEASKFHEQPNASGYAQGSRSAQLVHLFHLSYRLSELCLSINIERDDEGDLRLPRAHPLNLTADQVTEILKQSLTDWEDWSKTLDLPVIPLAQLPETADDSGLDQSRSRPARSQPSALRRLAESCRHRTLRSQVRRTQSDLLLTSAADTPPRHPGLNRKPYPDDSRRSPR